MNATTLIAALLTVTLSASAFAQGQGGLTLGSLCARADVPTHAEYDPREHADNFCALATHEPTKAVAQLNKMIRTTRAADNPNRFYFDRRLRGDGYVQLLRPWMVDENEPTGNGPQWTVRRYEGGDFTISDDSVDDWRCRRRARVWIRHSIYTGAPHGNVDYEVLIQLDYFDSSAERTSGPPGDPYNRASNHQAVIAFVHDTLDNWQPRHPCP